MRIIVISDTHGYHARMSDCIMKLGDFDMLVHLGDGYRDVGTERAFINADVVCVGGNNDFSSDNLPDFRVIDACGARIFCTHGHKYGVREGLQGLAAAAKLHGCCYAFYGHTHLIADDTVDGVRCMNPGSIGYPLNGIAAIEITESCGKPEFRVVNL